MTTQPLNLKKIFLCCYTGLSRLVVLSALLITASLCHSSTTTRNGDGGNLPPEENGIAEAPDTNAYHGQRTGAASTPDLPYDLSNVDKEFTLPKSLTEVSGLAWYRDGEILCVQDEKANIYTFDLEEEEVSSTFDFGKDGDYEDIAIAGTSVFVIRSDGRIFEVADFDTDDADVEDHNTSLSGKNNTEGLAYDQASHALLVACKDSPEAKKDQDYKGYRAVYRFDLNDKDLLQVPYLLVELAKLDTYREVSSFRDFSLRIALKLHLIESKTSFHPSAIAVHPLSGEFYMISSKGKIMVVLDREGNVVHVKDLDPGTFGQPEGICFSPEGDLFISNEGKGGRGTILRFSYVRDPME